MYYGMCLELNNHPHLSVDRVYGRSSGAIVGAFILCIPPEDLEDVYTRVLHYNKTMYIVDSFCKVLLEVLPVDAYIRCTNRLFVTCALWGYLSRTTSIFTDNRHLVQTLYTSGSLPFVTTSAWMSFHGRWPAFDGGLIDLLHTRRKSFPGQNRVIAVACPPSECWPDRIPRSTNGHSQSVVDASIEMGRQATRSFLLQPKQHSLMVWIEPDSVAGSPFGNMI